MNLTLKNVVLAAALSALPATAAAQSQKLTPIPNSHKYSDRGGKPTKARSDWAAIEARALMDVDGKTDIDVTTGQFEGIGGPGGTLEKMRVKIFENGRRVEVEKDKPGAATATLSFDGLHRGQDVEVKAHVSGDRRRKDVVTATTKVLLRPDLEPGIQAPTSVDYDTPFSVVGRVRETNGDVGARFDCRLFADGVQVAEILGAWVDAGQEVACHFTTRFASLGSKRLVVRADGVTPGDYDAGNNAVYADMEVVAKGFQSASIWYAKDWTQRAKHYLFTYFTTYEPDRIEEYMAWEPPWRQQTYGMMATQDGAVAANGRVMLRHFMDDTELDPIVADVADLGPHWADGCRFGYFGNGSFVLFCAYADSWYVEAKRIGGNEVIYSTLGYFQQAAEIAQGTTYRAELSYIDAANARQARLQGDIRLNWSSSEWSDWTCVVFANYLVWEHRDCYRNYFEGTQYLMTNGY